MYYYAWIDSTTFICYEVIESETPITDDPYSIQIDSYDRSYINRKKYIDGVWLDATPIDAQVMQAEVIGIGEIWLDDKIYGMEDDIANHTHTGYATSADLEVLEDIVGTKANANHTHTEYVTQTTFDALEVEVDGKASASHTHTGYASTSHTHTASEVGAATSGHNHDDDYSTIDHSHTIYATTTALSELTSTVSGKANASHSHNDTYYTETEVDTKLANKADATHAHTGVYDTNGAAANALTSAKAYTDSKVDALIGEGASTTLDTIGEIATAIEDNQDMIDTLNGAIANKANATDLTSHTGNTTIHVTQTDKNNLDIAKTHANTAHAPANAEANQNAFSNVKVGNTTISADTKTDTLTLIAGSNVTLTPNAEGDSVTIASTNTVYTHPTTAGNKHIPAGGSSGQILRWSADGTAVWGADNNTTYSVATQNTNGLMSAEDKGKLDGIDKNKLDGIAENANNYVLPAAGTALGGVKSGGDVTISDGIIIVNDDSHNHTIANVDGLQSALDGKAASSHGTHVSYSTTAPVMDGNASVGTASTVARSDHKHPTDTSRAAQTSLDSHTGNKSNPHSVTLAQLGVTATAAELNKLDGVTATTAELNYVDGVTSNIQTQLNGKAASGHTHSEATTSTSGFMTKDMVTKLNGIATGANAYTHPTYTARTGVPTTNQTPAFGGTFTVSQPVSDGTGHITAVNSRTITIPSAVATTSANGLMSTTDKSKLDGMVLATVSEVETYLAI